MSRGFYMHNRGRYFAQQGPLGPVDNGPPERGYLQADGVNDYGIALDAAVGAIDAGTAGEICMVVKVAGRPLATTAIYGQLCDVTGSPSGTTESITALCAYNVTGGAATIGVFTRNRTGGGTGDFITALPATTSLTCAMMRRNGTRELRGRFADAGALLADIAAPVAPDIDRPGDHVMIAARVNAALAPTNFANLLLVAAVVLDRYPTAGEVAAYSAADDARTIWPDAIHAYWAAADVVGTSIPARVGAVPMTLAGGWSAADLVLS